MSVSVATTVAFLQRRERARQQELAKVREDRRAKLAEAGALLREGHGATAAWLFGSLASELTHEKSDVDIAVSGLPPKSYWAALGELSELFDCDVDLVPLETAATGLRERILREGMPI